MSWLRVSRLARIRPSDGVIACVTLLACALVKLHYRHAKPEQLRWLLGPTAALSGLISGHAFRFESDAGYVSRELGLVIAPACAGANYLVIAFSALVIGFVGRFSSVPAKWRWFAASAVVAYLATLLTNSLRIGFSLLCRPLAESLDAAQRAQLHRVEGVLVYLASLLTLYAVAEARLRAVPDQRVRLWVPLLCYLGVTLLVPLVLGAPARPEFAPHALVVLLVVVLVVALVRAVEYTRPA